MLPLSVPERLADVVTDGRRLAPFTTWGVGGTPRLLITPRCKEDIANAAKWFAGEDVKFDVLGGGSNVLIADGELSIALLHTQELSSMNVSIQGPDVFIKCGAGVALRSVFSLALRSGWSGLEFAVGIPGTVGGAIFGNAGTLAGDMRSVVFEVETVERDGSFRKWRAGEIAWEYRKCGLAGTEGRILSEATLKLVVSSRESLMRTIELAVSGRRTQPKGVKTAGCVFKNPPEDSAGRLLDAGGCKQLSLGGARVSPLHANFIENHANCTADDILSLALLCRKRVFERFGIMLEFEIKFIGIPAERLNV